MIKGCIVKNFSLEEMSCHGELFLTPEMVDFANMVQDLRNWDNKPLKVNSWYRTRSFNKSCGGSPNSAHLDDEEEYIALLEEGRRAEQRLYGNHVQEWEKEKYLNRLRKQKKKQERELEQLELYWAFEKAKTYTQIESCPF